MGATESKWSPVRGADVWSAWGQVHDGTTAQPTREIGMKGTDVLDAAFATAFKTEWMAAVAGAVPFVNLPGLDKGILELGGAAAHPSGPWKIPELGTLYLWGQRTIGALHASVAKARRDTIMLRVESGSGAGQMSSGQSVLAPGASSYSSGLRKFEAIGELGFVLPAVAWVVIGVVGVAATMAGAWYAIRAREQDVTVNAQEARATHAIGTLADVASAQLAATGKIDPSILKAIAAIGNPPSSPVDWSWAWALGAGVVGTGIGVAASEGLRRARGRR